jgi:hypothetical protein
VAICAANRERDKIGDFMKLFILAIAMTMTHLAQASFYITCESINKSVDSRDSAPLAEGESWSIEMKGDGNPRKSDNWIEEKYQIKMTKLKGQQVVEGPFEVQSDLTQFDTENYSSLSFSIPKAAAPFEGGRFTIQELSKPYSSDPFIMYGWSTEPQTVTSAMFYFCNIQGIY